MKFNPILPLCIATMSLSLAACGAGARGQSSSDEIVVGVSEPLTGVGAAAGKGIVDAIGMAAGEINKGGGIDGRHIKVSVQDNGTDPAQCATTAQKLISERAVAIIGGWASSCTLAMQPITTRAEVPLLVETSSASPITDPKKGGGEWTFRMSPPSTMDTAAVSQFVKQLHIKKVFMLVENTDFGLGSAKAYQAMFGSAGVDVRGTETFAQDATTFRDQVTKAIAGGADTWAVTTEVEQLAQIMKEARGQGATQQVLASGGSSNPAQVIELAGAKTAEGLLATEYFPDFDPSVAGDPKAAKAFIAKWSAARKDPHVITEAARGYAAVYVLADAFKRAKDPTDRDSVRKALGKVDMKTMIYGHVKFENWCGLVNQNQPTITLARVHDGAVEVAGKAEAPYACPAS